MSCNDLRIGGTLSSSGLSGGTSINSTALMVDDWSSILGASGVSGLMQVVNNRPGGFVSGDLLGRERYPTLNMRVTDWGPSGVGTLVEATRDEQKQANTDLFLGLVSEPSGNYLELDMADGTSRFIYVYNFVAAPMSQPAKGRRISVPLVSTYPYWKRGGQENSNVVSGADTISNGGNRGVYDAVLEFAGDGTFTNSTAGWSIEVTGSAAAVTVDLGARTVTESGADALNRIRRTGAGAADWGWFDPGSNTVTADVSVTVTWRDSYQ